MNENHDPALKRKSKFREEWRERILSGYMDDLDGYDCKTYPEFSI